MVAHRVAAGARLGPGHHEHPLAAVPAKGRVQAEPVSALGVPAGERTVDGVRDGRVVVEGGAGRVAIVEVREGRRRGDGEGESGRVYNGDRGEEGRDDPEDEEGDASSTREDEAVGEERGLGGAASHKALGSPSRRGRGRVRTAHHRHHHRQHHLTERRERVGRREEK